MKFPRCCWVMAGFFVALSFWQVPTRLSCICLSRDEAHWAASRVHGPSVMEPVCIRTALRLSPELLWGLQSSKKEVMWDLYCFKESELASWSEPHQGAVRWLARTETVTWAPAIPPVQHLQNISYPCEQSRTLSKKWVPEIRTRL